MTLHVVKIGLLPDFNRDRKIDDGDQTKLIAKGPFRFWVNDDEDDGDVADDDSDIPSGNDPNHNDNQVNGRSDLLDFFPVWVNVEKRIEKQPPDITFQFCLRQDDSALKIVYTTLTPENAGSFLTAPCTGCGPNLNQSAEEATTTAIGASAVFPECFVDELENGNGVVMAEGTAASSSPLVLEIRNGNHIAFERKMPMSLSGVENMFRLVNLRNLSAPGISLPSEPVNLPDEVTDNANIFFLHGFRVTQNEARGWNSEMFKRLWQSASNSRYWGVTWNGDEGIDIFNYHNNVVNAFLTANKLKTLVNDSGITGTKTVMAHSLGNMVMCSAIVDHAMAVGKYFMLNAAVPSEAFGSANISDDSKSRLHHIDWDDYEEKTWSTKWHEYFPNDDRGGLTWIDRFDNLGGNVINFYSELDEVLMLYSSNDIWAWSGAENWWNLSQYGNHSWHKQEAFKGRAYNNSFAWACTDWCGWGFAMENDQRKYDAATANAMQPDVLAISPVFPLNPAGMNSPTISGDFLNELLAKGIPALSPPCGAGSVSGLAGQNMAGFQSNGWGRENDDDWLHSDIKNMAYYYTYRLFDKFLE